MSSSSDIEIEENNAAKKQKTKENDTEKQKTKENNTEKQKMREKTFKLAPGCNESRLGFIDVSGKFTSEVWKHFKKNKSIGKALCNHCSIIINARHGTNSLIKHLRNIHGIHITTRNSQSQDEDVDEPVILQVCKNKLKYK